jgi:hypothetical protein
LAVVGVILTRALDAIWSLAVWMMRIAMDLGRVGTAMDLRWMGVAMDWERMAIPMETVIPMEMAMSMDLT